MRRVLLHGRFAAGVTEAGREKERVGVWEVGDECFLITTDWLIGE